MVWPTQPTCTGQSDGFVTAASGRLFTWTVSRGEVSARPPWSYARSTARCPARRSSPRRCSRSTPERRCAPSRRLKELCRSRGGSRSRGGRLEAGVGGSRRKPAIGCVVTGAGGQEPWARRELASWLRSGWIFNEWRAESVWNTSFTVSLYADTVADCSEVIQRWNVSFFCHLEPFQVILPRIRIDSSIQTGPKARDYLCMSYRMKSNEKASEESQTVKV
jgi:hypothetical protein